MEELRIRLLTEKELVPLKSITDFERRQAEYLAAWDKYMTAAEAWERQSWGERYVNLKDEFESIYHNWL